MVENITQIKIGITINVDVNVKVWKNIMCVKKDYIWNPATCSCQNGKHLGSHYVWWNYRNGKNHSQKITMALLIVVSIYCYLIKYKPKKKKKKKKHLLPYYITNDKLIEVLY